jgi:hypothetical protein
MLAMQIANIRRFQFSKAFLIAPLALFIGLTANFFPQLAVIVLGAVLFGYFWNHKDKLIIFLIIYTPFEELFAKVLPDSFYLPTRYMWEAMLFGFMFLMLLEKGVFTRSWKKSPIDILGLSFLAIWIVSGLINSRPLIFLPMHIKNIIRYVPIFYIIFNLKPNINFLKTILNLILAMAIVQSIICVGEAIIGDPLINIFKPQDVMIGGQAFNEINLDLGRYQLRFTGSFLGNETLGNFLAYSLCFAVAAYFIGKNKSVYLLGSLIILSALLLSSSRISLISAYFGIGCILFMIKHKMRWWYAVAPPILIMLVLATMKISSEGMYAQFEIFKRFANLFSSDYYDDVVTFNRGYVIFYVMPAVFKANALLGIGPGNLILLSQTMFENETFGIATKLGLDMFAVRYVRDIGYATIFVQTGLAGLAIFGLMFKRFYGITRQGLLAYKDSTIRIFMLGSAGFLTTVIVQNWAVMTFIYRYQSLLFWTICGLLALFAFEKGKPVIRSLNNP